MPYHVERSTQCPSSRPWACVKTSDGKVMGCHPSKESAERQVAALYANEPHKSNVLPTDFKVGDRVRIANPHRGIPIHRAGTVHSIHRNQRAYAVRIHGTRVLHKWYLDSELAPMEAEKAASDPPFTVGDHVECLLDYPRTGTVEQVSNEIPHGILLDSSDKKAELDWYVPSEMHSFVGAQHSFSTLTEKAMGVSLNGKGKSHAMSLIESGKVDREAGWSFSSEDGSSLLGANGDDWANYGQWFLGVDSAELEDTKAHYKYPFGKGGKVYRAGVIAAKQRAAQQGATEIENAANAMLQKIDPEESKRATAEEVAAIMASLSKTSTEEYHGFIGARIVEAVEVKAEGAVETQRIVSGVCSSPALDRDGDIIPLDAWDQKQLNKAVETGMPLFFAHQQKELPIGKVLKVWRDVESKLIRYKALLMPEGMYDLADKVWAMMRAGFLKGTSIGFLSKDRHYNPDTGGTLYKALELLEISVVPIGSNRDAVITTLSAGKCFDSGLDVKLVESFMKGSGVTGPEKVSEAVQRAKARQREVDRLTFESPFRS